MNHEQDTIDFPASSYEGDAETLRDTVVRMVIALALVGILAAMLALMGGWEQESLEAHGDFMGRLEEQGAWVLR